MRRGTWATRFGIYLAAIGSAFGLGSLWRFPYIVSENGGGAFVILYFFLMLVVGVPLLVGELLIGKYTRRSLFAAQKQLVAQAHAGSQTAKQGVVRRPLIRLMPLIAGLAVISSVLILGYYSVVSGWVLFFLGKFMASPFVGSPSDFVSRSLQELKSSGWLQSGLATAHIGIVAVIVAKGVEEGMERWVGLIMPIFVGILSVLVFKSLSMSSTAESLRYFMYPDFSKLHITSLGYAVGQLCFTLSIGFGPMVTFGSYLRDESPVPATGFRVAVFDSLTTVIAGLLIFPLMLMGASLSHGPELMFATVPQFLLQFDGGVVFGMFFFVCLYLAALGASISILETVVANICENMRWKRGKASFTAGAVAVFASIVPALSSSAFVHSRIAGRGLLEVIDLAVVNGVVPLVALLLCLIVTYEVNEKAKLDEFIQIGNSGSSILYSHWRFLMKWVIPPIMVVALGLQIFEFYQRVR